MPSFNSVDMVCVQLHFVAPYGCTGPVVIWFFFTQRFYCWICYEFYSFLEFLVFCSHLYQTIEVFHQIARSIKDTWWISALVASLVISAGGRISMPSNMCPGVSADFNWTFFSGSISYGISLLSTGLFPAVTVMAIMPDWDQRGIFVLTRLQS